MRKGFTLIEVLVVVVISTMLASIAIVYSSQGRAQVALSVEATKVAQLALQAKQLAIATYHGPGNRIACGYGLYIDYANSQFSLFAYAPQGLPNGRCLTAASTTQMLTFRTDDMTTTTNSGATWRVPLANNVKFLDTGGGTNDSSTIAVIFYPPNPTTLITDSGDSGVFSNSASHITLKTADGNAVRTIYITPVGQITF